MRPFRNSAPLSQIGRTRSGNEFGGAKFADFEGEPLSLLAAELQDEGDPAVDDAEVRAEASRDRSDDLVSGGSIRKGEHEMAKLLAQPTQEKDAAAPKWQRLDGELGRLAAEGGEGGILQKPEERATFERKRAGSLLCLPFLEKNGGGVCGKTGNKH